MVFSLQSLANDYEKVNKKRFVKAFKEIHIRNVKENTILPAFLQWLLQKAKNYKHMAKIGK